MAENVTHVLAALTLIIAGGGATLWWSRRVGCFWPTAIALGSRLAYGLISFLLYGIGFNDGISYDATAQGIVADWEGRGPEPELVPGKEGFPYLLASMYRLFGHAPDLGVIINCLAAAALVVVTVITCRTLGWPEAEKPAAWIVAVWPGLIAWGSLLLRESIVTLLIGIAVLGAARLRARKFDGVLLMLAACLLMIPMRGGLAFLVALALPCALAFEALVSKQLSAGGRVLGLLGIAVGLAVAVTVLTTVVGTNRYFDSDRQAVVSNALDTGTTSFSASGFEDSGGGPFTTIVSVISTAIGPFPWQWTSFELLVVGLDAALWVGVWAMVVLAAREKGLARTAICWLPAVALICYLGATVTNFGLIMRLRALDVPLVAPVVGVGIGLVIERYRRSKALSAQSADSAGSAGARGNLNVLQD